MTNLRRKENAGPASINALSVFDDTELKVSELSGPLDINRLQTNGVRRVRPVEKADAIAEQDRCKVDHNLVD
jgi:hypothetical protein